MAEQIPYAVAASLVNRLASAAFREFGRINGVMDELDRLKSTVESIRAVLLDAEDKQEQSQAVQIWIRRLKDNVLHPADNLLDEFVIEDMRHKMDEAHKNKVSQDWEIKTNELIQLWMALGYLECSDEKQLMEDIVAGNDFCYLNSETKRLVGSPMYIMLESDAFGLLESLDASRMRSLILYTTKKLNEKELFVISKFKYLRVLKLSGVSLTSEPKKTTSRFGKLGVGRQNNSVIFSNWFSPLTNIVEISLSGDSSGLKYLPPMERLPFLKSLCIHRLAKLEIIYYEEPLLSELFFPSLEKLKFDKCEELRGWMRMRDDFNDDDNSSQSYHLSFPRLSQLEIFRCSKLTHMPTFPKLDKELILKFARVEALEGTLNMVDSQRSIEFPPLSMLKYLNIGGYDLNVKKLPKDWVRNLTSLKYLVLYKLPVQEIQDIEICFKDDFNYLPFLENITFMDCKDLKALPDWICNLSSLHHIKLLDCKGLFSLPKGMPRLAKLQTLQIIGCPYLMEQCEPQTSATWPKIAHIPKIILKPY
ncbi:hypothetical protein P8452_73549 [Trifolium repens]|nr:hypothetical protein P8452_73549 [Trifolium repens]